MIGIFNQFYDPTNPLTEEQIQEELLDIETQLNMFQGHLDQSICQELKHRGGRFVYALMQRLRAMDNIAGEKTLEESDAMMSSIVNDPYYDQNGDIAPISSTDETMCLLVINARHCLYQHSEFEPEVLHQVAELYQQDTGKPLPMSVNDLLTYLCSIDRLPTDAMRPKENRQPSEIN